MVVSMSGIRGVSEHDEQEEEVGSGADLNSLQVHSSPLLYSGGRGVVGSFSCLLRGFAAAGCFNPCRTSMM
jgi:hypothetical protein